MKMDSLCSGDVYVNKEGRQERELLLGMNEIGEPVCV